MVLADSILSTNLLSPPILFFFLGMAAALARSNLEIPQTITKMLSLYLLWAIGFKGGIQLRAEGFNSGVILTLLGAVGLSVVIPLYVFRLMLSRVGPATAAGVAATYGAVSAVTFLAATNLLQIRGVGYSGYMVAALAVMDSPAIIVAVMLSRFAVRQDNAESAAPIGRLLHDAFLSGPIVLMVGSMLVGMIANETGQLKVLPLSDNLFYGLLCFFLLDLGLMAGRNGRDLVRAGPVVIAAGIAIPLINAFLGLGMAKLLGVGFGDGFVLIVLAASASYIAVPAAMRIAIPAAEGGIFVPMALTLTFPFNIAIGLPLYWWLAELVLGKP
jgi:hypothetical protein